MRKTALFVSLFSLLAAPLYAADISVDQKGSKFTPDSVTAKVGDKLIFTNEDGMVHNVQVINADGDADDKGLQKPGQNITVTLDKAGTYEIRCSIHPHMKMAVTVQ